MKKNLLFTITAFIFAITFSFLSVQYNKPQGNTEIQITATGVKDTIAKGSEVWVKQISVDGDTIPFETFKQEGKWQKKGDALVSYAGQPAKLIWQGKGGLTTVTFIESKWSGKVQLKINNFVQDINLYAEDNITKSIVIPKDEIRYTFLFTLFGFLFTLLSLFFVVRLLYFQSEKVNTFVNWFLQLKVLPYSIIPICVWGIYLIAFFPGLMSADSLDQWSQMLTFHFNNHHPVFHTLTNWLITRIYPSPATVAIFQILAISFVLGYGMYTIQMIGVSRKTLMWITFVFALLPVNGMLAISLWKDVLYSACMLLLIIFLIRINYTNGTWLTYNLNIILLTIDLIFIISLRHNGIVPAVFTVLFLFLVYRKNWIPIIKVLIFSCLIAFVIQVAVNQLLNATPTTSWQAMSVPIHQVGFLVKNNVPLNDNQIKILDKVLPLQNWKESYNAYTTDPYVFNPRFNSDFIDKNKIAFLRVWAELAVQHPGLIATDFFSLASIIWEPAQPSTGYTYTSQRSIDPNNIGLHSLVISPFITQIFQKWIDISVSSYAIWLLWRPALFLYICTFLGIFLCFKSNIKSLLIISPLLSETFFLFLTVPAQDVRYMYSTILATPILISFTISVLNRELNTNKNGFPSLLVK